MPEQKSTIQELEVQAKSDVEKARALQVIDQTSYEAVAMLKVGLATFRKKIKMLYDPMVSSAKEAYDKIRGERDKHLKPVVEGEDILKRKIKDYENKKAFEAEQARKKAAVEAEEERKKKQAEAQKEAEAEAKEFGVPVEEVEVEEVEQEAPIAVHNIDKMAGTGIRRVWRCRITDKSKIPLEYLQPDLVLLNQSARTFKEQFNIPGVEAYLD